MRDQEIEQKIREASFSHPIKTSAYDILAAREKKKQEDKAKKAPWHARKGWAAGAISFGAVAIVVGTALGITLGKGTDNPGNSSGHTLPPPVILAPANNAVLNQASYELIAGIEVMKEEGAFPLAFALPSAAQERDADDEDDEDDEDSDDASLRDAIRAFDKYRPMVFSLEDASSADEYYVPVASDDPSYPYAIQVDQDFVLYYGTAFEKTDDEERETTVSAKLEKQDGTVSFDVDIHKEVEKEAGETETELATAIHLSSGETLTVSRSEEIEDGESESSYTMIRTKSGNEIARVSFDLEKEEGEAMEKTFAIEKDPDFSSSYQYEIKDLSLAPTQTMTLIYEDQEIRFDGSSYYRGDIKIYP